MWIAYNGWGDMIADDTDIETLCGWLEDNDYDLDEVHIYHD